MVKEMRYVGILGRKCDFDRVADRYVSKYDIHIERASGEILEENGLLAFDEANPYAPYIQKIDRIDRIYGLPEAEPADMPPERALREVDEMYGFAGRSDDTLEALEARWAAAGEAAGAYGPYAGLDADLGVLDGFELLHCFFAKAPINNFIQYETFIYAEAAVLFVEGGRDGDTVWGLFLTPREFREKTESAIRSFHFETVALPREFEGEELTGPPAKILDRLSQIAAGLERDIENEKRSMAAPPEPLAEFAKTAACVRRLYALHEARRGAARTERSFFVLTGWMETPDAKLLEDEMEKDGGVIFAEGGGGLRRGGSPPTKLGNPPVVRFFEFFVNLYGVPAYGELDPTPFIAVTYTLLFGWMFGDLGQGAVISLLGVLLYKLKKMPLGAIMSVIGLSSMVFGALYGSVFGFEDIIPALWRRPGGDVNTTLIIAVGLGVFLILAGMAANMINAVKQRDYARLFFSPTGLAGFAFYGSAAGVAAAMLLGHIKVALWIILLCVVLPAIALALREPLGGLVSRGKSEESEEKKSAGVFIMEAVLGVYDVVLSYFTNTISFIRVGAFALSHAMMMSVVLTMSQSASGSHNAFVVVIGNVLVMAMEGMVVGIQVLRLNFYELFSKFYDGGGREFRSYKKSLGGKR
ncbi:MAG: hypothetical protein FWC55_04255 [Firmicutes bacterium]|nr:hypothetical protein [Bacillota bacterium]